MLERGKMERGIFEIVDTEGLVPEGHLLRKIDVAVDFNKIYDMVEPLYCADNGRPSVAPGIIFVDGTHIKANANTKKTVKREVPVTAKRYAKKLMDEVNADREAHGKKPFEDDSDDDNSNEPPTSSKKKRDNTSKKKLKKRKKEAKKKTVTVSTTDPDCGLFIKGDHKKQLAYEAHTACDVHGVALAVEVAPGNVHDSVPFDDVYDKVVEKFPDVHAFVADSAYKTPHICKKVSNKRLAQAGYYSILDRYESLHLCD